VEGCDFEANKAEDGWHYAIQGVYERELDEIGKLLDQHLTEPLTQ
jgi:hypothetical protein